MIPRRSCGRLVSQESSSANLTRPTGPTDSQPLRTSQKLAEPTRRQAKLSSAGGSLASNTSSGARGTVQSSGSALGHAELIHSDTSGTSRSAGGKIADHEPTRLVFDGRSPRQRRGSERYSLRATQATTRRRRSRSFGWLARRRAAQQTLSHQWIVRLQMIATSRRSGRRPNQLHHQEHGDANQLLSKRL